MTGSAITYDEVVLAAVRALREGKNITKPLIRERLGNRGSHSTIQKHLNAWRETLSESDLQVLPPSMPPELAPHIEALWNAATSLVETSLAAEWLRANAVVESAEIRVLEAGKEREQWALYAHDKDLEIAHKNTEIKDLRHQVAKSEERLKIRDLEYQALQGRLDDKERAIANEREAMAERINTLETKHRQARESDETKWQADRKRLEKEAEAAKARTELEIRRSDQHEIYFLNEVRKARDETQLARERGKENVEQLNQELLITRRREESGSVRLGKIEDKLMVCQQEREAISEKAAASREMLLNKEEEARRLREYLDLEKSKAGSLEASINELLKANELLLKRHNERGSSD